MKKVGAGGCRPLFFRNSSCYRFKSVFWPADRRIDSWKYRRQIRDIQEGEKMSLKTVYHPYFKIGAAAPAKAFSDARAQEALLCQYDSLTCENEMKPQHLLDEEENRRNPAAHDRCPAVSFQGIRVALDFARENGMKMRGHTLVWHNQTPRWFFTESYSDREDAPLVDRETMLARLEGYIRSVLCFVQEEYPGIIYAWDVVNEAKSVFIIAKS